MQKVYSRINWENEPSTNTPLSESNLNKMDYALDQIDNRVVQLAGYQDRVSQSEKNAKTSEENAKVSETNAKQSELKSKEYMESAFKGTPEGYQEVVEKVDSMEIKTTKENTIKGTKNGGFRLTKFVANTVQNGVPSPENQVPMLSTGDCVEMIQGSRGISNVVISEPLWIASKDFIPCKNGDNISLNYDKVTTTLRISFYDSNKSHITKVFVDNGKAVSGVAPTNASYFACEVADVNGITPHNAGKITITINGKYLGCVKTRNENMYGGLKFANDLKNSGATVLESTNEYVTLSANANAIKFSYRGNFKENTRYTFFVKGYNGATGYELITNLIIHYTDGTYTYLEFNIDRTRQNVQVSDEGKTIDYIAGTWNAGISYIYYDDFGIMEGVRTLEDFKPYRESTAYFLTDYQMIKGSTLFRENGLVKAMHTTTQQVFNGDESIYIYPLSGENVERFYINVGTPRANLEVSYCSHLPFMVGNDDTPHYRWSSSGTVDDQIMMFIPKNLASTVDEFKAWLASNPVTVMWGITPIIETLDTASQIALNGLETFDGVTHIVFDSRVQPLEFEAEVGLTNETARLLKNELRNDTLEVKLEDAITTMLLITP